MVVCLKDNVMRMMMVGCLNVVTMMLNPHWLAMTGDILLLALFVFICEDDAKVDAGNNDDHFPNSKGGNGFLDWD